MHIGVGNRNKPLSDSNPEDEEMKGDKVGKDTPRTKKKKKMKDKFDSVE